MASKIYKIKSGDTLSAIAKKYKTTVSNLKKLNNIKDANKIFAGQSIKIKNIKEETSNETEKDYLNLNPAGLAPLVKYSIGNLLGIGPSEDPYSATDNLSPEAKDVLFQAIKNAEERGSSSVTYRDYPLTKEGKSVVDFITPSKDSVIQSSLVPNFISNLYDYGNLYYDIATDPVKEVATFLGSFNFNKKNNDKYNLSDRYDYHYAPQFNVDGKTVGLDVNVPESSTGYSFPVSGSLSKENIDDDNTILARIADAISRSVSPR